MSKQNGSVDVLPALWVDRIFAKLAITYGRDFLGRWEGMELAPVQSDWGYELRSFKARPAAIAYALESLPQGKPPTVIDFKAMCSRMPDTSMPELPAPDAEGLKRIASTMAEGLRRAKASSADKLLTTRAKECLDNLREMVRRGSASPAQRDFLKRAEAGLGFGQEPVSASGELNPATLPMAMRGQAKAVKVNSPEWFVSAHERVAGDGVAA